ncbi:hypothetical protein HDC30_002682 [Pseudomonas sp. JAI115]|nr:hypothetical protein [Pseudomonas sp. JAI115]
MGGRITVESVAGCSWSKWPDGRGIRSGVRFFRFCCKACVGLLSPLTTSHRDLCRSPCDLSGMRLKSGFITLKDCNHAINGLSIRVITGRAQSFGNSRQFYCRPFKVRGHALKVTLQTLPRFAELHNAFLQIQEQFNSLLEGVMVVSFSKASAVRRRPRFLFSHCHPDGMRTCAKYSRL